MQSVLFHALHLLCLNVERHGHRNFESMRKWENGNEMTKKLSTLEVGVVDSKSQNRVMQCLSHDTHTRLSPDPVRQTPYIRRKHNHQRWRAFDRTRSFLFGGVIVGWIVCFTGMVFWWLAVIVFALKAVYGNHIRRTVVSACLRLSAQLLT
ncbi:hypothetical protein GGS21DRAFT_161120 [Xylaria nigripes]|nr:hypothetical protein GGS21DRAFT_161120 [Xylaria nigripes]